MPETGRGREPIRQRDRLSVIFAVGILLPGIMLVVLAGRALLQERSLAEQQLREQLDTAAQRAAAGLEGVMSRWQDAVEELAASGVGSDATPLAAQPSGDWPSTVRDTLLAPDGGGVLVSWSRGRLDVMPEGRLLYDPTPEASPPVDTRWSLELAQADQVETVERDYIRATKLYEKLLARTAPADRAELLHRLARTSRKAGALESAMRYYTRLQDTDARVAGLPAGLVAAYGICLVQAEAGEAAALASSARELYDGLTSGRWLVERARYLFYSAQAREWLGLAGMDAEIATADAGRGPERTDELTRMRQNEIARFALTAAVDAFLDDPRPVVSTDEGLGLAFWQEEPLLALVLPASVVETGIWAEATADVGDTALAVSLLTDEGRIVFGGAAVSEGAAIARVAVRDASRRTFPLTVQVTAASPTALQADVRARQALYLTILALSVALLAFGGYLTVRAVRREVEVARLKSRFVSAVSHEFRSPLTGIHQLAEMLMRDRVPGRERRERYYRMIARESSRLTRLVENVLDFSRIEEGRREYVMGPVDATPWLTQVADEFREEVAEQDVALAVDIPADLPLVRGDREALSCVVHNLLDNAVKYSAGAARVRLEADVSGGRLAIRVHDQGLGIAAEDRERVFEQFVRGSGPTADEVKGVGLGLSLVRHIVTAHGGTVGLKSEQGIGSTFTVELPIETGTAEVASQPTPAPGGPGPDEVGRAGTPRPSTRKLTTP